MVIWYVCLEGLKINIMIFIRVNNLFFTIVTKPEKQNVSLTQASFHNL